MNEGRRPCSRKSVKRCGPGKPKTARNASYSVCCSSGWGAAFGYEPGDIGPSSPAVIGERLRPRPSRPQDTKVLTEQPAKRGRPDIEPNLSAMLGCLRLSNCDQLADDHLSKAEPIEHRPTPAESGKRANPGRERPQNIRSSRPWRLVEPIDELQELQPSRLRSTPESEATT